MKTLEDQLHDEKKLVAGQMVSTLLLPKLEVYGFLATRCDDCYLALNPGDVKFLVDKVVTPQKKFPIYKHIEENQELQKLPLNSLHVVWMHVVDPRIGYRKHIPYARRSGYVEEVLMDDGSRIPFIKIEPGDLTFRKKGNSAIDAISRHWMVVCRRLTAVTNNTLYELYDPADLYPLREEGGGAGQ